MDYSEFPAGTYLKAICNIGTSISEGEALVVIVSKKDMNYALKKGGFMPHDDDKIIWVTKLADFNLSKDREPLDIYFDRKGLGVTFSVRYDIHVELAVGNKGMKFLLENI